jgi:AraC-like DNA-binding protein
MERLAEGASDLTAVALGLGFASHSHFSSAFRREFALPPSVFRRELALASSASRRIPLADDDCERARN